ncbi:MAG: class I SAM-dependent methyltransferase [Bacteroidales bacterium]|nr:class I SAM-dependent methyltransferase [Bacteroidales bacterium]
MEGKAFYVFFLLPSPSGKNYKWLNDLYFFLKNKCKKTSVPKNIYRFWKCNNTKISFQDPGSYGKIVRSKVKEIFRRTSKSSKQACKLAHIARFIQAKEILELGTGFGTTSLVLKLVNPHSKVITVEGVKEIANMAKETFSMIGVEIELLPMNFTDALRKFEDEKRVFNFIFLDGHHEPCSSEMYINHLLPHMSSKSILIIDDIFYNKAMNSWWMSFFPDAFSIKITTWDAGILIKNPDFKKKEYFTWKILL